MQFWGNHKGYKVASNITVLSLGVVALVILVGIVVSLRLRQQRQQQMPDLGSIDGIFPDVNEKVEPQAFTEADEEVIVRTETKNDLDELGFGELDEIFADANPTANSSVNNPSSVAETAPAAKLSEIADATHQEEQADDTATETKATSPMEAKLVVINIIAKGNNRFVGYELLQALLGVGLRFGEMSIFHKHQQPNGKGKILYSLAGATEPGTFDMNKMGAFSSNGLTLFMQLIDADHNEETLQDMVDTAKELAEDLDGNVYDAQRKPLNDMAISQMRAQIRKHLQSLNHNSN